VSKETYLYIPVRQMGVQNSQSRRADARTERAREITLWRCLPWVFMCLYVSLGAWCTQCPSQCLPTVDRRPKTVVEFNSRTCVYMYSVKSDKMCEVEVAATSRQRHADRSKARVARHYNRVWRAGRTVTLACGYW
jgi:hypothetical protein